MTIALSPVSSVTRSTVRRDLALLVGRIGLGFIFVAHGWQKLVTNGIDGVTAGFSQMGIPLPGVSAWFSALVELVGGGALILGAAVPLAGLLLAINMVGALFYVHLDAGLFATDGGYELVLALAVGALMLAGLGSGRFGLDALLVNRRATAADRD